PFIARVSSAGRARPRTRATLALAPRDREISCSARSDPSSAGDTCAPTADPTMTARARQTSQTAKMRPCLPVSPGRSRSAGASKMGRSSIRARRYRGRRPRALLGEGEEAGFKEMEDSLGCFQVGPWALVEDGGELLVVVGELEDVQLQLGEGGQ